MPDKKIRLRFLVLTKTKTPSVEAYTVEASPYRVQRTVKALEHTWRAIAAEHFFPAPNAMNCPACPFQTACKAWSGD